MSKIYIFKKNNLYDSSYTNVIAFSNELERSNYINETLMEEGLDWEEELDKQPDVKFLLDSNIKNEIEIAARFNEIKDRNYLVLKDVDGNVSFHFLQTITNNGNNNKCTIEIHKDIFMNNINIWDKMTNFKMNKGHANIKHYLDKEFDSLFLQPTRYQTIKRKHISDAYDVFNDTPFIYVIEKVKDGNEAEDILKTKGVNPFLESFKVYIAPVKSIPINKGSETINYIYTGNLALNIRENQALDLPLTEPIDVNHNYLINYALSWGGGDSTNLQYTLNGKYFPSEIGEVSYISLGGNIIVDYNDDANYLNEQWYLNGHVITDDESRNIAFAGQYNRDPIEQYNVIFKITKLSEISYQFGVPTSGELVNLGKKDSQGNVLDYFYWEQDTGSQEFIHYFKNNDIAYGDCLAVYDTCSNDNYPQHVTIKSVVDMDSSNTWNAVEILRYISTTRDSTIITAKKSNFNALILNEDATTQNISFEDLYNLVPEDVEDVGTIYRLTEINYDIAKEINSYQINFPFTIKNELLLNGLLPFRFILENEKEFKINNLFFQQNNNAILIFNHYASVTPEWEERIKFEKSNFIDITTDDNLWKNEKEFALGQSQWDTYKTNQPVTSKLGLRIFGNIARIFKPALFGSIFSDRAKIDRPERADQVKIPPFIYNNKSAIKGGVIGIGSSVTTILERSNIRNVPETSTGTGDLLGDLIFNYSNSFMLVLSKPYGNDYISLVKTIYRDGLEFDQEYYTENINLVKRTYFNYIKSNNIFENVPINILNMSNEELAVWIMTFKDGVRIWWNYNNYLNFGVINEEINV